MLVFLVLPLSALLGQTDFSEAMRSRYAPYADWAAQVDLSDLEVKTEVTWKAAEAIRKAGSSAEPLAGLKLALDPGHVGGVWAKYEGREFRISEEDHLVREGELVLEVAQVVAKRLSALGAEIVLLRDSADPVNPKGPAEYIGSVLKTREYPEGMSLAVMADYAISLRNEATHNAIVVGELAERARLINRVIQPDAVLSLHINAAPWPEVDVTEVGEECEGGGALKLVDGNHLHVLVFGCMSEREMQSPRHLSQLFTKLRNGSGPEELGLAGALAHALAEETDLPSSLYSGRNAVLPDVAQPYVWARNLMLLRMVECPVVLLEPYVANSKAAYARIQSALGHRAEGDILAEDDILVEYADGVVGGVLDYYGFVCEDSGTGNRGSGL